MSSLARKLANLIDNAGDIKSANLDNVTPATPTNVSDQANTSTGYFDVPAGTTEQRPSSPNVGFVRFNTTLDQLEQYTSDGWKGISAPPTITAIDTTNISADGATKTIVVTGQNFDISSTATLQDGNGATLTATSSTRNSSSQITMVYSGAQAAAITVNTSEPLTVKVTNGSGLVAKLEGSIGIDDNPVWSSPAAGSNNDLLVGDAYSLSLSASDPETGGSISYSLSSGTLPSGITVSGSSISGTTTGNSDYNSAGVSSPIEITATGADGDTTVRSFNIVRKWRDGSTATQYAESANAIYQINSSATNGYYYVRNYGTATPKRMYCDFTTTGGPWTIPFVNTTCSTFSTNGSTALATYLNLIRGVGIGTPGRGMESSRSTSDVYGAWLAVKKFIHNEFPGFFGSSQASGVLLMPMLNINGEGGSSDHRLVYNTSLGTHIPSNYDGDRCDANQLFCGHWGGNDRSSWTTNNNNTPGPEDWGPSNPTNTNDYATGGGGDFTILDPLVAFGIYR